MNGGQPRGEVEARGYRFEPSLIRAITTEAMRLQHQRSDVTDSEEGPVETRGRATE